MGIQQSRVQLCTQEQYLKHKQMTSNARESKKTNSSFFKIQQCQYPHPLIEKGYKHNQHHNPNNPPTNNHQHKCTMKHSGYPDTYQLCSQCQKQPQKLRKNHQRIFYQQSNYTLKKPQPTKYDYKPTQYKQKEILAPGPQLPTFYNGFSLPIDRYYKQKTQFIDEYYPQPTKGSPYRQESKPFEESVYEQVMDKRHSIQHERQVEFGEHLQNLKFKF